MASSKVQTTEPVDKILEFMNPVERKMVVRVLRLLEDDVRRDVRRRDLNYPQADNKPTWGFAEGIVWVAFVEEDDGAITVIHASLQSRFRARRA